MKKVLFTIGMITILVGFAFAGMASYWNPPTSDPILLQKIAALDAKVTNIQSDVTGIKGDVSTIKDDVASIVADLANRPIMETISGDYSTHYSDTIVDLNYGAEVRHVSLSLRYSGLLTGGYKALYVDSLGGNIAEWRTTDDPTPLTSGYIDLEFNTSHWSIDTVTDNDPNNPLIYVSYKATITYVPSP
jgi:hypothetical protein